MGDRIGQQLSNYHILREIGRGGFADVYLGEHVYLKSHAALKVLHTSLADVDVARFLSEAQTLVRLRHPHIVRVLEFAIEGGAPVLMMDYAPGGTVRQLYSRGLCLPLTTIISYLKQVASALQYAHSRNIIHRDVKPENLLLGEQQEILLSDFGLALLAPSPEELSTQEMAGTILYMAPEQLGGKPCFASDQYALGVVIYEWLCGHCPFTGSFNEIAIQHLVTPPPSLHELLPTISLELEQVVMTALAKEPGLRFVSVQAFAHAFESASRTSMLEDESPINAAATAARASPFVTLPEASGRDSYVPVGIFLAASPADSAFTARLHADLKARRVLIWNGCFAGTMRTPDQEELLRQEIRAAQLVVLVLSPATRASRLVKEQLRIAGLYERQLLLLWQSGNEWATLLPEEWEHANVLDVIDAREMGYGLALDKLVSYLEASPAVASPLEAERAAPGGEAREPRNPYKGLRAFTVDDSGDFFGRDPLVEALVKEVAKMMAPVPSSSPKRRLLTVVGPSGSGKSSAVMAGLLPRLQQGAIPGSEQWIYLDPMVPGKHPIEALGLTQAPYFPDRSFVSIREDLEDDSTRGLHVLASQLVSEPGRQVVLLIDQFEELFTQTDAEEERRRFIDLLLTATTEPRGPLLVLITLRADFYDRPMQYPELHRLMQQHQVQVLPMEVEDLRTTIEQPATLADVQLTFEGNLVGDLLFEMQGQRGALPLLEFTLEQLFEQRSGHRLTLSAYRQMGGVKGALAQHAEATYAALPAEEHRRLARALFLRLIDPGTTEQDTTRRRAALTEFSLADQTTTRLLRETADAFIAARLLTTNEVAGTTTLEVSHEAVIREWKRLADWIREAREDLHLLKVIREDAAEWRRYEHSPDRLYRGTQLTEALAWRERSLLSLDEEGFLEAGAAEQARQEALLVESQQQEAWQRKRYTRRTVLVGLAGVGLAVTAAAVSSVLLRRNEPSPPQLPPLALPYSLQGHTEAVESVAWSPDGKRLASASDDATVRVWDATSGQPLLTYHGHSFAVTSVAWSPDGKRLASASLDQSVQVWDASNGHISLTYRGHTNAVTSVAWSPDGKRLTSIDG